MATLSLRIRDDLKKKAKKLAEQQGVSLNNFVNASIASVVAHEEAMIFFQDRLKDMDLEALHRRVIRFMGKTKPGKDPSEKKLREAMGNQF